MKKPRIHRAWAMLFGCCMLQGGSLGIVHNCRGIFYTPVIEDLGFGMGAFTFFVLLFGVFSSLILPTMGRFFSRYDCRVLLSCASVVFAGSTIFMGFFHTLPAFYVAGAFQGLSGAFLMFFPAPLILGNWFKKKTGLAIGISSAFSGVAGIIGNPIGNAVIQQFGWRVGYFFIGGVSLLMMLPVSLFLLRLHPADLGMCPYGDEGEAGQCRAPTGFAGISAADAKRSVWFWLLIVAALFSANLCSYHNHLSPLGIYAGYGDRIGALMMSCSMAGNILSKILLGHVYDRFGLKAGLVTGTAFIVAGFTLLLVPSQAARLVGSFFYGTAMAMSAVMMSVAVKDVYGSRGYKDLLAYASISATLGTSVIVSVIGFVVDALGPGTGYTVCLVGGLAMTGIMALLLALSVPGGRRLVARVLAREAAAASAGNG